MSTLHVRSVPDDLYTLCWLLAHPFEFPSNGDTQRKQPGNHYKI